MPGSIKGWPSFGDGDRYEGGIVCEVGASRELPETVRDVSAGIASGSSEAFLQPLHAELVSGGILAVGGAVGEHQEHILPLHPESGLRVLMREQAQHRPSLYGDLGHSVPPFQQRERMAGGSHAESPASVMHRDKNGHEHARRVVAHQRLVHFREAFRRPLAFGEPLVDQGFRSHHEHGRGYALVGDVCDDDARPSVAHVHDAVEVPSHVLGRYHHRIDVESRSGILRAQGGLLYHAGRIELAAVSADAYAAAGESHQKE